MAKAKEPAPIKIDIIPLNENTIIVPIMKLNDEPLVILRLSEKAKDDIMEGETKEKKKVKKKEHKPRNYEKEFQDASYRIAKKGWHGINCMGFKNGALRIAKILGFHMVDFKRLFYIVPDGYDYIDNTPLVKIISKPPIMHTGPVRLKNGSTSIRARPMYNNWSALLTIKFDADFLEVNDMVNLFQRVGAQNGIGEGRIGSKSGSGMGWGSFMIDQSKKINIVGKQIKKKKS